MSEVDIRRETVDRLIRAHEAGAKNAASVEARLAHKETAEVLSALVKERDELRFVGRAKLTAAIVRKIRAIPNPNMTQIAREYGVDQTTIKSALRGKTWKNV